MLPVMASGPQGLGDLLRLSPEQIEELFQQEMPLHSPRRCFRGQMLFWLESPESHHWLYRPVTALLFQHLPFGVDFDRSCWFFVNRRLRAGRFEAAPAMSRWRPARVFALSYWASRLPGPVKSLFYDEVKPLNERLCLGIGGLNLTGEPGVMFFFGLERL